MGFSRNTLYVLGGFNVFFAVFFASSFLLFGHHGKDLAIAALDGVCGYLCLKQART